MMFFQANPDAGIHLTLGSGIAAIFGKILWDEFRGSRKNGNGNGTDLRRSVETQTQILNQQTNILQAMAKDIAVVLDRTK